MFPKIKRNDSETQMKIAYYPLKMRRMQDTENILLKECKIKLMLQMTLINLKMHYDYLETVKLIIEYIDLSPVYVKESLNKYSILPTTRNMNLRQNQTTIRYVSPQVARENRLL